MKRKLLKITKYIGVILVSIAIVIGTLTYALRYFFDYLTMRLAYDYKSREELCEILEDNMDAFEEAVEILSLDGERYWIDIETASHKLFPFVEALFGDHIFIEGNKNILTRKLKKEIRNSKIDYILNELDFVLVTADTDKICFINRTAISIAPQIIYSRTGKAPEDMYLREAEKIIGNWYYCLCE